MNAVEFIFALLVVFGSTAVILAWTTLVYRLENKSEKTQNNDNINLIMFGR